MGSDNAFPVAGFTDGDDRQKRVGIRSLSLTRLLELSRVALTSEGTLRGNAIESSRKSRWRERWRKEVDGMTR